MPPFTNPPLLPATQILSLRFESEGPRENEFANQKIQAVVLVSPEGRVSRQQEVVFLSRCRRHYFFISTPSRRLCPSTSSLPIPLRALLEKASPLRSAHPRTNTAVSSTPYRRVRRLYLRVSFGSDFLALITARPRVGGRNVAVGGWTLRASVMRWGYRLKSDGGVVIWWA